MCSSSRLLCSACRLLAPQAVSPEKEDYYADILIYVTGCVLFILAVVIVMLCRMRMTTQKTLPTPPVQKLSKFPLKRQVTESRYEIPMSAFFFFFSRSLFSFTIKFHVDVIIWPEVTFMETEASVFFLPWNKNRSSGRSGSKQNGSQNGPSHLNSSYAQNKDSDLMS